MKNEPDFIKITKKEYNSLSDSDKKKCILTKEKGKQWQYFKSIKLMKKTKLQKLTAIKKNLENRLTKLNNESFRIQSILLENGAFFNAVENALNNGWASNEQEQEYCINLLFDARDGDEDSLKYLRGFFKNV